MANSLESGFIHLIKNVLDSNDVINLFNEPRYDFGYAEFSFVGRYFHTEELRKEDLKYWKIKAMTHEHRVITMLFFYPKGESFAMGGAWPDFFRKDAVYFFKGIISQRFENQNFLTLRWAYEIPIHEARMMHRLSSLFPQRILANFRNMDEEELAQQMMVVAPTEKSAEEKDPRQMSLMEETDELLAKLKYDKALKEAQDRIKAAREGWPGAGSD